ncbi:hypothetical protein CVT25_012833 [Psilocybe cyanescens]|uniref:Uncharacterized protein n=1 Tax=Psilocybe cyanescens TaxID=93625 RepID=A0A409XFC6_PSICY|nr:hypothetical protein CVT25_012833 [Psilocybe cyanescens]
MSKPLEIEVEPWKEIGLSKPARSVTKILKGGSSKTDWKTSDRSSKTDAFPELLYFSPGDNTRVAINLSGWSVVVKWKNLK